MRTSGGGYCNLEMRDSAANVRMGFGISTVNAYFVNIGGSQVLTASNNHLHRIVQATIGPSSADTQVDAGDSPNRIDICPEPPVMAQGVIENGVLVMARQGIRMDAAAAVRADRDSLAERALPR